MLRGLLVSSGSVWLRRLCLCRFDIWFFGCYNLTLGLLMLLIYLAELELLCELQTLICLFSVGLAFEIHLSVKFSWLSLGGCCLFTYLLLTRNYTKIGSIFCEIFTTFPYWLMLVILILCLWWVFSELLGGHWSCFHMLWPGHVNYIAGNCGVHIEVCVFSSFGQELPCLMSFWGSAQTFPSLIYHFTHLSVVCKYRVFHTAFLFFLFFLLLNYSILIFHSYFWHEGEC